MTNDKSQFIDLLSNVLSEKLGGTKYKDYLPLNNLKKVTLEYINSQIKEKDIKLSGLIRAQYNSMLKKCNNTKSVEAFISVISETLFNLQGF